MDCLFQGTREIKIKTVSLDSTVFYLTLECFKRWNSQGKGVSELQYFSLKTETSRPEGNHLNARNFTLCYTRQFDTWIHGALRKYEVSEENVTVHNVTVNNVTVHNVTVHNVTVRNVTAHNVTVHNVTVHNVTVHNVTVYNVTVYNVC